MQKAGFLTTRLNYHHNYRLSTDLKVLCPHPPTPQKVAVFSLFLETAVDQSSAEVSLLAEVQAFCLVDCPWVLTL